MSKIIIQLKLLIFDFENPKRYFKQPLNFNNMILQILIVFIIIEMCIQ